MRLTLLWARMIADYALCLLCLAAAVGLLREKPVGGVVEFLAAETISLLVAAGAYKDAGRAKSKIWPPISTDLPPNP
jgi:hypothetical protein